MDNDLYMCNDATCTITTTDPQGLSFFLFICGDYDGGILQAMGGNLVSITPFCATLYSCLDPLNCWTEDIQANNEFNNTARGMPSGVKAVSVMPGCELDGKTLLLSTRRQGANSIG